MRIITYENFIVIVVVVAACDLRFDAHQDAEVSHYCVFE